MNREFQRWITALALAVLFILARGYTFNTDDQAEHLPQVYQMLDPDLYPYDYFVQESNRIFTVRYYYEWLIYGGALIMPVSTWCFLLMLFFTSVMTYSIQRIYETLFASNKLSWLAPLVVLVVFNSWTVGGNGIFGNGLICSLIAKSMATFGLWRFLKEDRAGSGIALGLATLFQPLVGMQMMLIQGFALLPGLRLRAIITLGISFVVVSSPMLVPLLSRQAALSGHEPQLFWDVMYRFRNHLHYLPSLFPATHFIKSAIMLGLAVGLLRFFNSKKKSLVLWMIAGITLGLMAYTISLETLGFNGVGKTQWFKTTIWIAVFGGVCVAALVAAVVPEKLKFPEHFNRGLTVVVIAIGLFMITNSANFPWLPKRLMVGNYVKTDQEKMHEWIEKNTPKDAVFLTPPTDYGFQCQAKRSIPIGFKAIIHEPDFMLRWYRYFERIYGVGLMDVEGRPTELVAEERYYQRPYNDVDPHIDYRLDDRSKNRFVDLLGPMVHQQGDWILTEFEGSDH